MDYIEFESLGSDEIISSLENKIFTKITIKNVMISSKLIDCLEQTKTLIIIKNCSFPKKKNAPKNFILSGVNFYNEF